MVSRFLCGRDRQSFEDFSLTFAGRKCILKANRIKIRRFLMYFYAGIPLILKNAR